MTIRNKLISTVSMAALNIAVLTLSAPLLNASSLKEDILATQENFMRHTRTPEAEISKTLLNIAEQIDMLIPGMSPDDIRALYSKPLLEETSKLNVENVLAVKGTDTFRGIATSKLSVTEHMILAGKKFPVVSGFEEEHKKFTSSLEGGRVLERVRLKKEAAVKVAKEEEAQEEVEPQAKAKKEEAEPQAEAKKVAAAAGEAEVVAMLEKLVGERELLDDKDKHKQKFDSYVGLALTAQPKDRPAAVLAALADVDLETSISPIQYLMKKVSDADADIMSFGDKLDDLTKLIKELVRLYATEGEENFAEQVGTLVNPPAETKKEQAESPAEEEADRQDTAARVADAANVANEEKEKADREAREARVADALKKARKAEAEEADAKKEEVDVVAMLEKLVGERKLLDEDDKQKFDAAVKCVLRTQAEDRPAAMLTVLADVDIHTSIAPVTALIGALKDADIDAMGVKGDMLDELLNGIEKLLALNKDAQDAEITEIVNILVNLPKEGTEDNSFDRVDAEEEAVAEAAAVYEAAIADKILEDEESTRAFIERVKESGRTLLTRKELQGIVDARTAVNVEGMAKNKKRSTRKAAETTAINSLPTDAERLADL